VQNSQIWSSPLPKAISNTSPLLYLHRIGVLNWLPELFEEIWVPRAVVLEMETGYRQGYTVPGLEAYAWIEVIEANPPPSEWLSLDLGPGELAAMALALQHPDCIVLLDDALARKIAQAADLQVWGTLRVLLEAKSMGLTAEVKPWLEKLSLAGMWLSPGIQKRILALAGED
jgi:predicted nucleic acid-binding protein